MEQKKILLVAISAGVFLIIVIGAAILVFGSNNVSPVMASARPTQQGIPVIPRFPVEGQALQPVTPVPDSGLPAPESRNQTGASLVGPETSSGTSSGGSEGTPANTPVEGDTPAVTAVNETPPSSNSSTVISVSRPNTVAVPDAPPVTRTSSPARAAPVKTAPAASTAQTAPAPTQPIPEKTQTASTKTQVAPQKTQTAPRPPSVASVAPRQPVPNKLHNNYWVQTGAFRAMTGAEGVKETLAAKGITSIIENRDVNGTTFFRVRVGPYTSQNEADYWLSLIKSINGFEESQVFQSQSQIIN